MENTKINFLDLIYVIVKGKKFIFFFTLIMSVIAVVYTLVVPEKWASEFIVYPLSDSGPLSRAMNLMEGLGFGSQTTPKATNIKNSSILRSRKYTESTIIEFDLINYFQIKEKDPLKAMDNAVKRFHDSILQVIINEETHFLTVRLTTDDKHFSKLLADHYLQLLLTYTQDNSTNIGRQRRELLETRITQITEDMQTLTEELKEYQIDHNIIEIELQAKASIESYSTILKEIITNDLDLNYQERFLPNSPRHKDLQDKRSILLETLSNLESDDKDKPFLLALGNINESLFTIQEKVFGREIYEKILQTIYPQLELARIEEINNIDRIEIIDYPALAGRRVYPKRAVICMVTCLLSFCFACGCVIIYETTSDEDKLKIKEIYTLLLKR